MKIDRLILAAAIIAIGMITGGYLAGRSETPETFDPGERWYAFQEYAAAVELVDRDLDAFGADDPQTVKSSERMKEASKRLKRLTE